MMFVEIKRKTRKIRKEQEMIKQVTRGHNIVADGWAGASTPHPHPMPPPPTHIPKKTSKTLVFPLFDSWVTDGPTDGRTD